MVAHLPGKRGSLPLLLIFDGFGKSSRHPPLYLTGEYLTGEYLIGEYLADERISAAQ